MRAGANARKPRRSDEALWRAATTSNLRQAYRRHERGQVPKEQGPVPVLALSDNEVDHATERHRSAESQHHAKGGERHFHPHVEQRATVIVVVIGLRGGAEHGHHGAQDENYIVEKVPPDEGAPPLARRAHRKLLLEQNKRHQCIPRQRQRRERSDVGLRGEA